MKKNKFISDMIIITAISILLTFLGMSFRIFISNEAGAECMGLYQLVYTVYIPACTVAASGINLAAVRLISANEAQEGRSEKNIMKACFAYSLFFGALAMILLFFVAEPAGKYLIKNTEAASSLKILAFGLPFLSAASAVNGYFTAKRKIIKTVLIQITEDAAKIAVTVTLLLAFKGSSAETLCGVLVFGSAAGEIISCLIALIFYIFEKKPSEAKKSSIKPRIKELISIAIPTAVSSYVRSGLSALENMLVPFGYRKYGYSEQETLEHIGIFRGMVMPLMMFPSTLLGAAAKLLIPEISFAYEQKDVKKIESIAVKAIYSTLLFSFFVSGIFLFFSKELCDIIYGNQEAGILLMLLSALVPIMYLDGIVDAILKGINQQIATMRYSIIDSIISVILILILLPKHGVRGYVVVTYLSSAVNAFLGISRFLKVTDVKFSIYNCITVPFFSAAAAIFPIFVFNAVTDISTPLIADVAISAVLYVLFIFLTKSEKFKLKKPFSNFFKHFRRHSQTFTSLEVWFKSKPTNG